MICKIMSEEVVEQITRDPPKEEKTTGKKAKDPKKVAAGKKLAENNKMAREALARETQRAAEQNENIEKTNNESKAWLPELSFTTVLSIIGIGFTAFDMFMRYRQKEDNKNRIPDLSQVPQIPQPFQAPPIKVHNPQTNTQAPTLVRPKIGMM